MRQGTSYEEVAVLEEAETGVQARITRRRNPRGIDQLSYNFFRSYEHKGERKETTWFSPRHLVGIIRLAGELDERLRLEREKIVRGEPDHRRPRAAR
jgi:hypothetical protein